MKPLEPFVRAHNEELKVYRLTSVAVYNAMCVRVYTELDTRIFVVSWSHS